MQGNKFQLDRTRDTMVLSFSFLELGQLAVSNGSAWLTPICIRAVMLDKVQLDIRTFSFRDSDALC